jgi:hypothetical protein
MLQTRTQHAGVEGNNNTQESGINNNQKKGPMIFSSDKKEAGPGYYLAKGEQAKQQGNSTKANSSYIGTENENSPAHVPVAEEIAKLAELFAETSPPSEAVETSENKNAIAGVNIIRQENLSATANTQPSKLNEIELSNNKEKNQKEESAKYDSPEFKQAIIQLAKECALPREAKQEGFISTCYMTAWSAEINGAAGYLITQYSGSKMEHAQLNLHLINKTREYYDRKGATCFIYDEITMPIEKEDFNSHSEEVLFSESFSSGTGEAVVKFIKAVQEKPKLEYVKQFNKYKISAQDLVLNVNVGASLYLHLPKNEKFYLYLNEKAVLSHKQKQKLIETNTSLYIEAEEVKKYENTFARNRAIEKLLSKKTQTAA